MKNYIVTILLEALLLQNAWAGPFSNCVECPTEIVSKKKLII